MPNMRAMTGFVNTPACSVLLRPVDRAGLPDLGFGGEGRHTCLLAGNGARIAALDIAESIITVAAGPDRNGIYYLADDGVALPFRSSAFDAGECVHDFDRCREAGAAAASSAAV